MAGLVGLGLTTFIFPLTLSEKISQKYFEARRQNAAIGAQVASNTDQIARIEQVIENWRSENNTEANSGKSSELVLEGVTTSKFYFSYSREEIKMMFHEIQDRMNKIQSLQAEKDILREEALQIEAKISFLKIVSFWTNLLFAVMVFWGFWNWYTIQKLADQKLRNASGN